MRRHPCRRAPAAIALGLLVLAAASRPGRAGDDASSEEANLMALLEQETEIATRTKLNRDFVPGMVTVLDGDMLEAVGARTVLDALSLVPGIQVLRDLNGSANLSVRGITFPFNAGNMKVLVDSVGLSREDSGGNPGALLMPIEMVERIEIVRGPGSSIHGAFAFSGVVNIVTRHGGRRVFATADSERSGAAGAHLLWGDDPDGPRFSADAAAGPGGDSSGPVGADAEGRGSWASLRFERKGLTVTGHRVDYHEEFAIDPGGRLESGERSWAVEARDRFAVTADLDLEARLAYLANDFTYLTRGKRFAGARAEGEIDLFWRPVESHDVFAAVEYSDAAIDHASLRLPPLLATSIHDEERRVFSLAAQDQVELGQRASLTLGLRYDDLDDTGSHVSPRAGLVVRLSDHHILKAQYTDGFRPPSFWELYAPGARDASLDPEVMRTAEIGYVYRRSGLTARVTAFKNRIDDLIYLVLPPPPGDTTTFDNARAARAKGVEAEWEQVVSSRLQILANVSWVDTWDGRSTSPPSGDSAAAADWIANAAVVWRPARRATVALRWLHVGERHTFDGATPGYDAVDLTAGFRIGASWQVAAGVKNALDDDVTYPIAYPNATRVLPWAPRTGWVRLAWTF